MPQIPLFVSSAKAGTDSTGSFSVDFLPDRLVIVNFSVKDKANIILNQWLAGKFSGYLEKKMNKIKTFIGYFVGHIWSSPVNFPIRFIGNVYCRDYDATHF